MNDQDKQNIEHAVAEKTAAIKDIDMDYFGEVVGVSQAIDSLKTELGRINECLDQRQFEKASNLGYDEVAHEFVFLQRCLSGLQNTVMEQEKLIQDISMSLVGKLESIRYEDIAPYVEKQLKSLKPIQKPETLEIQVGEKTLEKLNALTMIRQTPVEQIVEKILASAMQNHEQEWRSYEEA